MIIVGDPSSTWTPPAPPPTSKYFQRHNRRIDSPRAGAPSWAELGAAIQALAGARRRWAASEGLLSPTEAGNLRTERNRRGGEGRGERGASKRAVGEGPDNLLEERGGYGDVTWREAGEDVRQTQPNRYRV